jgi:hypothetical protein
VTPAERGEAVPAGGVVSPAPGRLRAKATGRHYDRPAGIKSPAALGRQGADNTRSSVVSSQEVRELELSGGVRSLPQVPWWNADRRARDASRAAAPGGVVSWSPRLSAFRFLSFFLGLSERDRAQHRSHRRLRHDAIGLRRTITAVASARLARKCVARTDCHVPHRPSAPGGVAPPPAPRGRGEGGAGGLGGEKCSISARHRIAWGRHSVARRAGAPPKPA